MLTSAIPGTFQGHRDCNPERHRSQQPARAAVIDKT